MTDSWDPEGLIDRANALRTLVANAANRAGRSPDDVTIIAVSKTFPRSAIDAAYDAGFRVFGESRIQEIRQKFETPLPPDASLHLIGPLQTNKVRQAIPHVSCIQTVDRPALIESLAKQLPKFERTMPVLIQVNISGEEQKSGCDVDNAATLLSQITDVPELRCDGLMTMAPYVDEPETIRHVFRELRELRDTLQESAGIALPVLSMGMSGDFEIAIEEGATHVRIGRSLFGSR